MYFSGRAGFLALGFLAKQVGKRIPVPAGPYCARKCGASRCVNFGMVFHRPTFCRQNYHQEQAEFTAREARENLRPLYVAYFFGIALHFETGGEKNNRPTRTHCARGARKSVVSSCSLGEFVHISYKQLLPAVQHQPELTAREHVEFVHVLFRKSGLPSLTF